MYPTAIGNAPASRPSSLRMIYVYVAAGSEPQDPTMCSKGAWQRVMQGHAAANLMPVVASNRIGEEPGAEGSVSFYGGSFIADQTGLMVAELRDGEEGVAVHAFDLDHVARQVASLPRRTCMHSRMF